MADERALKAIERIEKALARIDVSASRPRPAEQSHGELTQLKKQHQALRHKVETAISQIDRLLETEVR